MKTLNISLPEQMRQFIDEQVAGGGYGTASEYLRELIRNAQKEAARARLEKLFTDGLESGDPKPMTRKDWDDLKDRIRRESAGRKSA